MAAKAPFKTTFAASEVIRPIFTGGAVSIENDARILATVLGEDAILTDIKTGKHLAKVEGDGELISTLTLTPSGSHLIICSRSLSMRIYSLQKTPTTDSIDPHLVRTVRPHTTPVAVLAVDRTSTLLATGGTDGSIKVWDINGGYVTHTFRGPSVLVSALLFFELATTPKKKSESSETTESGKRKKRHSKAAHDEAEDEVSTTARFRLASGSQDGKVRVWDLHKRSAVANLDSHASDVRGLDYSSSQNMLVTASRDKTIRWWDARSWEPRKVVPCFELLEAVGFIGDGQLTYSAGSNGCLRIWQTDTGRELTKEQKAKPEAEAFITAVYRPGFPFIACVQVDHTITLFNTPADATASVITSPEPFRRISGTHDDIIDLRYLLPDHSLMALATNSEDIRIVSVSEPSDSTVLVPSEYFGQDIALLRGHDDIIITLDVDWSGHWVATGAKDNTAKIWRVDPKNDSYTWHSNSVLKVTWLNIPPPEERSKKPILIASAGGDGLVKVWDINSGDNDCTLDNHEDRVWALAVHPDTNMIVSGSGDSTVTFWKDTSTETQTASNEAALKLIEQEQELDNYEYAGAYREAITLALQLNHPRKLQSLFEKVVYSKTPDAGSLSGAKPVDEVLATLSDEQLFLLLLRLRDWNTNARTAPVAQRILWTVVKSYPASRLSSLSVKGAKGQKSVKEVLNGLKVYTERHYKRMEELVDESYLVEYTLSKMDALAPNLDSMKLTEAADTDVIMT
ncbi:hypothetical protein ONZ43_g1665 [Nemania bipapillata]|uniref:Uncharacterized protein n=1 Tax=Nemania bipapillata TaxID=110536 RepID=A0ACC2J3M9_9PEZI|nr:hypothetical protein ONZ43_g1665 [Nemania bipapillata]